MPGIRKAIKRDKARHKAQYGHKEDGRSVFLSKQEIDKRIKKARGARK